MPRHRGHKGDGISQGRWEGEPEGGDLRLKEGTGWVGHSEPEGPTEGTEVSEQERDFPRTLAPSSHCPTPSLSPEPLGTRGHRAWWPRLCALQPPHPTPPAAMEH